MLNISILQSNKISWNNEDKFEILIHSIKNRANMKKNRMARGMVKLKIKS